MTEKVFNQVEPVTMLERMEIIGFLHEQLKETGESKEQIGFALDYAMNSNPLAGGFILRMKEGNKIVGIVVMNKTGMQGYVPENILVYIVIHPKFRRQGLAKKMMTRAMQMAKGDIAMHVHEDNPEYHLSKDMGFQPAFLQMRYIENNQ